MNIKIIKNFVSKSELKKLNEWTLNNFKNSFFTDADMGKIGTRLTTRYVNKSYSKNANDDFEYPEVVYCIKDKIIKHLNIEKKYSCPPIGKDSIVNGIGFDGGDIYEHVDPVWFPYTYTIHCNIISQKPLSGGVTIIDGKEYDICEGDVLIYVVSHLKHSVTKISGGIPRISWCYGFSVGNNTLRKIFDIGNKKYFTYS